MFGNFVLNFGGYDSGIFALANPKKIVVSPSNNLFVIDGSNIIVFDQYGNGINIMKTEYNIKSINITFNNLLLNSVDRIFMSNLKSGDFKFSELKTEDEKAVLPIISSLIFNGKLYILNQNGIRIYGLVKS